jgi:multiple sugar transport system substrate-binding protein
MGMKKLSIFLVIALLSISTMAFAKSEVSIYWAEYDGLTPEYAQALTAAFEKANPDITLKIVSTPWNVLHDKLITSLGAKQAPDLSVIGTRWLLEFMDMGVVEPIEQHLSKQLLGNIPESIMEGKIKNVLYGLPMAIGPRIMYYRTDLMKKAPETFEEMREIAKQINKPPDVYGVGMSGAKYTELTEFAYYLYGNGGDFFAKTPDGAYGKCIVNNEAGVKALTFMNDLVNKDKVTQPSTLQDMRDQVQDLFVAGKLGFMMSGGFTGAMLNQRGVKFGWAPALIPHFEGKPRAPLFITDSVIMFNTSKDKAAAGKFLDFFFQDEWRLQFDKLTGFPPVTKSLGPNPQFQTPTYQAMVKSMDGAKAWPLMVEWPECNDIIWKAISATFLGQKDPQKALNDAAAEIDALRK